MMQIRGASCCSKYSLRVGNGVIIDTFWDGVDWEGFEVGEGLTDLRFDYEGDSWLLSLDDADPWDYTFSIISNRLAYTELGEGRLGLRFPLDASVTNLVERLMNTEAGDLPAGVERIPDPPM